MTLQGDASKTETATARHAWLHDATGDEALAPATTHKISIFGLGYVGAVSLACLARGGHEITGVDIDSAKLEMLRRGQAPIVETGIQELTRRVIRGGKVTVTDSVRDAVLGTDVSFICVGTPARNNGNQNLDTIARVAEQIGAVREADVLVVASKTPEALAALQAHTRPDQLLLDVVGLPDRKAHDAQYRGVCW
jgi:GDP-mannose 6-dehydrogenase